MQILFGAYMLMALLWIGISLMIGLVLLKVMRKQSFSVYPRITVVATFLYRMAECCDERGEYEEALKYYENALRVLDIYKVKDGWYGFRDGFNEEIDKVKEKLK